MPDLKYDKSGIGFDANFSNKTEQERKNIVETASKRYVNGYNHNQRPQGFVFSSRLIQSGDVYVIETNHTLNVVNTMEFEQDQVTILKVHYLDSTNKVVSTFHCNARKLAETWEAKGNKCRRKCVEGGMNRFGVKAGSGNMSHFSYWPTKHNPKEVNKIHKRLNIAVKKIAAKLFPCVHEDIQRTMLNLRKSVPSFLGGDSGLCCEMTQSQHSLVTEYHVDQDISKSLSIWSVQKGHVHDPEGWYFVLPFLSCTVEGKKYRGVAVKLKHGAAIEWDGRVIFHCTIGPDERQTNCIGTFFGVTVV